MIYHSAVRNMTKKKSRLLSCMGDDFKNQRHFEEPQVIKRKFKSSSDVSPVIHEISNEKSNPTGPLDPSKTSKNLRVVDFLFGPDDEELKPELEDGKITRSYFERVKMLEYGNLVFSLTSLGISSLQYILEYEERDQGYSYALLSVVFVCTILLIALTVIRYSMQITFNKIRKVVSKKETIWSTGQYKYMLAEMLVVSLHPSPFLVGIRVDVMNNFYSKDIYYHLNEFLHILILLRIIIVARVILVSTMWNSNRSIRVCNMYGTRASYLFAFRCLMKTQSFALLFTLMGLCLLLFGYALMICEAPLSRLSDSSFDLSSLVNAIWCTMLTITSVGYGDFYPRSGLGRIVVFLSSVSGISIISMMVVTITNTLSLSSLEERALTVLTKLTMKESLKKSAARILSALALAKIKYIKTGKIMRKNGPKVKKETKEFSDKSR